MLFRSRQSIATNTTRRPRLQSLRIESVCTVYARGSDLTVSSAVARILCMFESVDTLLLTNTIWIFQMGTYVHDEDVNDPVPSPAVQVDHLYIPGAAPATLQIGVHRGWLGQLRSLTTKSAIWSHGTEDALVTMLPSLQSLEAFDVCGEPDLPDRGYSFTRCAYFAISRTSLPGVIALT